VRPDYSMLFGPCHPPTKAGRALESPLVGVQPVKLGRAITAGAGGAAPGPGGGGAASSSAPVGVVVGTRPGLTIAGGGGPTVQPSPKQIGAEMRSAWPIVAISAIAIRQSKLPLSMQLRLLAPMP
jgi:hypothetical protein